MFKLMLAAAPLVALLAALLRQDSKQAKHL
jgi:hypothetical protein